MDVKNKLQIKNVLIQIHLITFRCNEDIAAFSATSIQ